MRNITAIAVGLALAGVAGLAAAPPVADEQSGPLTESPAQRDARMAWWRQARFGMFIHWGLYAIPAGEWHGETRHAEWIRTTAQIPIDVYEQFVDQFNPVNFDADGWARMAADAGMKYIVITSKHHDGFCLFDSQYTDFDVMSTPFKRDIMRELAEACRRHGLRICWYHSIMDWHHPDYLPRRGWEREQRPAAGADYDRYVAYMKNQLRELVTNYGPIGVLWFDGEWEGTWTRERGLDLYNYVRGLQPDIIINNRVGAGRAGMAGMTKDPRFAGDFGTPEQEIPPAGIPGVDWESCITMNRHWGYNKHDHDWKSTEQLIHMLVDIASKGGNFLLNVGPRADGTFPPEAIDRLREIGAWMDVNGESIYGTQASPFKEALPWGRCTTRCDYRLRRARCTLYLHVFDWPADGRLVLPELDNPLIRAYLLADQSRVRAPRETPEPPPEFLDVAREPGSVTIDLPADAPDPIDSVVVLEIWGDPRVISPPDITALRDIFVDALEIRITPCCPGAVVHYTADGSDPTPQSPRAPDKIRIEQTTEIRARQFRDGQPFGGLSARAFTKVEPRPAAEPAKTTPGLSYEYYEGQWDRLPDFDQLTPVKTGTVANFDFSPRNRAERFGFRYRGFVEVPRTGVYTFYTLSDDGSRLCIGEQLVVDNDGLHGVQEAAGIVPLAAGLHPLTVTFFEKTGGDALEVWYDGPGIEKQRIPAETLTHTEADDRAQLLTPSPRQMAWQELEFQAFVHFGMNTFTDREWGAGTEDPALFDPAELDARQWIKVFKDAGMKGVVLSAKHHDGFCLWPSKYTAHSVASSPWRGGHGDLVREVADACREAGLKLGIYLSPWDRHEPTYGDSSRYNQHFKNQLTELLSNYGPTHEVWFDGACGEGPNGKKQVYDWPGYIEVVRKLQPDAVIFSDAGPDVRWIGNERGFAGETNWSTLRRDEFYPGTPKYKQLTEGHEHGTHWVPAECDVSIRPGWFYHASQDDQVKSLADLLDIYYQSVGRNAVLLLNVPPDRRGLIHENDAARLRELRSVLDETFRLDFATGRTASADSVGDDAQHGPGQALDGDPQTWWIASKDDRRAALTVELDKPATFDRAMIQEAVTLGQRIRSFALEAWDGQGWNVVADGTTVGYKRLLRFNPVTASRVRLAIRDARASPAICELGLFKASPREPTPARPESAAN